MAEFAPLRAYQSLSREDQLRFLVRLGFELTLVARAYYEPGTDGLTVPSAVRAVNELQHQVTQHARAVLEGDDKRYPDDVLIESLTKEVPTRDGLAQWVQSAFVRAYQYIQSHPLSAVG